ncbi:hypothetical protein PENTCL1PPCAC_12942, partial [Pristionchus entomophagus]
GNVDNHSKQCDDNQFTLHKLDEKIHTTPQCIMCNDYPKTASSYASHLHHHHKSSLKSNGVYLMCACGLEFS